MTTRIGIEPGRGLVGRFGDTVIFIPRDAAAVDGAEEAARELLGLAAEVASDRQRPASAIAARLAGWVIGHMPADATAFGMVAPVDDGVVMFLRGAVWCAVTEADSVRQLSGEQALTWVDQIIPGTFERLAIGSAAARTVQADPLSDLRDGVVPGQGFVLTRLAAASGQEPVASAADPGRYSWSPPADAAGGPPASAAPAPAAPAPAAPAPAPPAPASRSRSRPGRSPLPLRPLRLRPSIPLRPRPWPLRPRPLGPRPRPLRPRSLRLRLRPPRPQPRPPRPPRPRPGPPRPQPGPPQPQPGPLRLRPKSTHGPCGRRSARTLNAPLRRRSPAPPWWCR